MKKAKAGPFGRNASSNNVGSYDIGYGKPPANFRFKKGTSGNPRGRPKAPLSISKLFAEELNRKIPITENGKVGRVTKLVAVIKRIVNEAALGHHAMIKLLLNLPALIPDIERNDEEAERAFREIAAALNAVAAEKAAKTPDRIDL